MPNTCPLCGQSLPASLDELALHTKLDKLTSAATQAQRRSLEKEFAARLAAERQSERKKTEREFEQQIKKLEIDSQRQVDKASETAIAQTKKAMNLQLEKLKKEIADSARKKDAEVDKARRLARQAAQQEIRLGIQKATLVNERKMGMLQTAREKEQVRHSTEMANLQGNLDELSRRLEKQSAEQFGEEGEINLYAELVKEFPEDKIERIGRGTRGADILQRVKDSGREVGRIVYESKNTSTWQKAYLAQAKKYHTQYETPYVMVVSRVFPKKRRGMCVVDEIPIVDPCLATTLASVIREGVLQIAKLRLTRTGSNEKAQVLFTYVTGNEFQTRFRDLASAITNLKDYQRTEQNWHENHWAKESDLHTRIEKRYREIDARLHLISRGASEIRKPMAVVAGRRLLV